MIYVVGVGPGSSAFLTQKAIEVVKQAHIIVGGKRNLEIFDDLEVSKVVYDSKFDLVNFLKSVDFCNNIVFLASGEPMLYGIFSTISKHVGKNDICVIPGISAVQYLCSKLKISIENLITLSVHGIAVDRDFLNEVIFTLKRYKKVAIFTDLLNTPKFIISRLMKDKEFYSLIDKSKETFRLYVGENLSYENEKILEFRFEDINHLPEDFAKLNTILITIGGI